MSVGIFMPETQEYERKRAWNNQCFKEIGGFANSKGGVLEIGRDDETGELIGLVNVPKLMKDLPNMIRDKIGIVADIDLIDESGGQFIRITVSPSTSPVSYNGKYYQRSGETTQLLNGHALTDFLLKKQGRSWDGITIPNVKVNELDTAAFKVFRRKALESGRFTQADLDVTDEILLGKLKLVDDGCLTRAAVLLFHEDPTRYFPSAFVKIGLFDDDVIRDDEVVEPIIAMPDKLLDIIYSKYLSAELSFEGIRRGETLQRQETYPVPPEALREAVVNAILHRDYSSTMHTQIRIYDEKIIIHNAGSLPANHTFDGILQNRQSLPHNPSVAEVFFRARLIERWGRGINLIKSLCKESGKPEPTFESANGTITVTLFTGVPNGNGKLKKELLKFLNENPYITREELKKLL